jgi:integrase
MGRTLNKLLNAKIAKLRAKGRFADGGGLYLQIAKNGSRSWIFRYKQNGRERHMGLGPFATVALAEARDRAHELRRKRLNGTDPLEERRLVRAEAQLAAAREMTFVECAESFISSHRAAWQNSKHRSQWENTLKTYVYPHFGTASVQNVDVTLILKALEPIWHLKPETASRVRGRIESVLDWASARGFRQGDNPARWRGHLDKLLPATTKVRKVRHHPSLPYDQLPQFLSSLRSQNSVAAKALEFLIHTAARTSEVIGARWEEVDVQKGIWTLPPERMKAKREHCVPLTSSAISVLQGIQQEAQGYVFSNDGGTTPLSNMALLACLRRMGRKDITAHGFRSTFRTWVAECTSYPSDVAEAALAHMIGDKLEAAYQRGDLFEKRWALMRLWSTYCEQTTPPAVVSLRSKVVI